MKKNVSNKTGVSWTAQILTLFPEMFPGALAYSLSGKALKKNLWSLDVLNLRDYSSDDRFADVMKALTKEY